MTSTDMSLDCDHESSLETEIETLHAIYIHELKIERNSGGRPSAITIQLHPATADNAEEQYVCLTLILNLPREYPQEVPEIIIRNPRGLSDIELESINNDLKAKATQRRNGPMLYELIELAKEHLTLGNTPSCECAVCLYGFNGNDIFTRTQCYHYFHSYCLSRYVKHTVHQAKESEKENPRDGKNVKVQLEVGCPVCRLPIPFKMLLDKEFPPPTEMEMQPDFALTPKLKQQQSKMRSLYRKQKAKGGIIDIDAERNKFLIEISSVSEPLRSSSPIHDLEVKSSTDTASEDFGDPSSNKGGTGNVRPQHNNVSTLDSMPNEKPQRRPTAPRSNRRKQGRSWKPRVYDLASCHSNRTLEGNDDNKECNFKTSNGRKEDSASVPKSCVFENHNASNMGRRKQIALEAGPGSFVNGGSESLQYYHSQDSISDRNDRPSYFRQEKRQGRWNMCGGSRSFNRNPDGFYNRPSENISVCNMSNSEWLQGSEKPPDAKCNRARQAQNGTSQSNSASWRCSESYSKSHNSGQKFSDRALAENITWANKENPVHKQQLNLPGTDVITRCVSTPMVRPPPGFAFNAGSKPFGKPPPGFFKR